MTTFTPLRGTKGRAVYGWGMEFDSAELVVQTDGDDEQVAKISDVGLSLSDAPDSNRTLPTATCDVCGKEQPAFEMNYVGSTEEEHAGVFCSDKHTPHLHPFGKYR